MRRDGSQSLSACDTLKGTQPQRQQAPGGQRKTGNSMVHSENMDKNNL